MLPREQKRGKRWRLQVLTGAVVGGGLAGLPESPHRLGGPGSPHTPHAAALAWDAAMCGPRPEDTSPCSHRKVCPQPRRDPQQPQSPARKPGGLGPPPGAALSKGTEMGFPRPPRRLRQPWGPERHSEDSAEASSLPSEPGDTRRTRQACQRPPCRDGRRPYGSEHGLGLGHLGGTLVTAASCPVSPGGRRKGCPCAGSGRRGVRQLDGIPQARGGVDTGRTHSLRPRLAGSSQTEKLECSSGHTT